MRTTLLLLAIPTALTLAACGQDTPPAPKTTEAPGTSVATQSSVPPAQPDRTTAPADAPATHSGTPQPEAPAAGTARDTAANQPLDDLSKAEENTALPKAGQVNNHSSPAMDKENKTTSADGGKAPAKAQ
ncbi:MAG: hypothetical protein KJ018_07635 [Burkholderiales bacterium]|nr:hypothetical protein [Burkholderiales bacterium]